MKEDTNVDQNEMHEFINKLIKGLDLSCGQITTLNSILRDENIPIDITTDDDKDNGELTHTVWYNSGYK